MLDDNISLANSTILLTGAAGFIGANLAKRLIEDAPSAHIVGIDNMNDYYDPALTEERQQGEDGLPLAPYAVYNIGNSQLENLLDFVDILQQELIRAEVLPADYDFEAHKRLVPMQAGDVPLTFADTSALERDFGFRPHTPLCEGLRKFAEWYKSFYG